MDFRVRITYDCSRRSFRRQVSVDGGRVSFFVRSEHGDNGACPSCRERIRFVTRELAQSGVDHAWDDKKELLTFPGVHMKTAEEALSFLGLAMPNAAISFSS